MRFLSFMFPHQQLRFPLTLSTCTACLYDASILKNTGEEYKSRNSSLRNFLHLLYAKIFFFRALSPNTRMLCSSRDVRDKVSHSYKTRGKICMFLDIKRVDTVSGPNCHKHLICS